LGVLALTASPHAAAAVGGDPADWTCEECPFEEPGVSGHVDVGAGYVSDSSSKRGDFTGLDQKGGFANAGGALRYRGKDGYFANAEARDLGLDTRSLAANAGREGLYSLRVGYAEIPHLGSDTARTPFLGAGGADLTLPAGFPADTTAAMPLTTTLRPVELGVKRSRIDLGASVGSEGGWRYSLSARRDVRDGTERKAGSFYATTTQLPSPVNQVTNQIEASAAYSGARLHATLAYSVSTFRNDDRSLTWQNPFTAGIVGTDAGQLALAPDNSFHQLSATVGYQLSPAVRASGDIALGRATQDARYLAPTLNGGLLVAALPATSLDGRVDTLDASLRLTAAATDRLRLAASLTRNEHDNKTTSLAYQQVSTDMFVSNLRSNLPYSYTRDRLKLSADWRGPDGWKLAGGAEHDRLDRTNQETGETREATVWARVTAQPLAALGVSLKLAHAQRDNSGYDARTQWYPTQNPLMRMFNQADRRRDSLGLRADWNASDGVSVGFNADLTHDDYTASSVGLTQGRSASLGGDVSAALSDATKLRAFVQTEQTRSDQAGSAEGIQADWSARVKDTTETLGLGITHSALKGKLDLGADLALTHSRSAITVQTGMSSPFQKVRSSMDSVSVFATWHVKPTLSVMGSLAYESYESDDWRLDGVLPDTVANFLAFGEQAPRYHVTVLRLTLRQRF
jgi:MtrB/PioB family decaheme-associated outer membrane protein